jgi:N6-L-threonylcarbamoyladenine synthase
MLVLGIETSCDETSLALVDASGTPKNPRFRVLQNLVSSQIKVHAPFGGVVPNLAKREHTKNLPILYGKIFGNYKLQITNYKQTTKSKSQIPKIDMVAVTVGPGLEPALWTGIEYAKALAKETKKMLIGSNHLEGHLYSFLLGKKSKTFNLKPSAKGGSASGGKTSALFPAVQLLVSGGHTILVLMHSLTKWKKLGETRDDAAGEAFDKVARILGLPYPGGPEIEQLAKSSKLKAQNYIPFPRPMLNQKNYDFSFSGLKTAVLYFLREQKIGISNRTTSHIPHSTFHIQDVAASFQAAAIDVLVQKTLRAAREYGAKSIMLSGGVAANKALRRALTREAKKMGAAFIAPEADYNTDNAAMIAVAGYMAHFRKKKYKLEAQGNLNI